jgi:predicted N-acetyltransferase YhbS
MLFRTANAHDVPALARLHAESWRSAYRGILSDVYLDSEVDGERLELWRKRWLPGGDDRSSMFVIVAEEAGRMVGFSCVFLGHDPFYGSFLDNLHVAPARTGSGIGSELLRLSVERVRESGAGSGLYLWVLEKNLPARSFYQRHGGIEITPTVLIAMPDGQSLAAIRCCWRKL